MYKLDIFLGEGAGGAVWLASRNKQEFAVKIFNSDINGINSSTYRELSMLKLISDLHPNIISLKDVFIDGSNNICAVYPKLNGNFSYMINLAVFTYEDKKRILYEVSEGLRFLHDNHICHRDIKPDNILLGTDNKGNFKPIIADLGVSRFLGDKSKNIVMPFDEYQSSFCGTDGYMAPEIEKTECGDYPADVWAFGVLVYELYKDKTINVITNDTTNKNCIKFLKKESKIISGSIGNLLKGIFEFDVDKRLNIHQVKNHSYFNKTPKYEIKINVCLPSLDKKQIVSECMTKGKCSKLFAEYIISKMYGTEEGFSELEETDIDYDTFLAEEKFIFKRLNYSLYI